MTGKRERRFDKIADVKEFWRRKSTDILVEHYNSGYLGKEGAVAVREVLQERGELHRIRPD